MGTCYEHFFIMYQWGDCRCHHVLLNWNLLKFCPMCQFLPQVSESGPSCSEKNFGLKSLEGLNCQQQNSAYWILFSFSWCDSWGSPVQGQELDFGLLWVLSTFRCSITLCKFCLRSEKSFKVSGKPSLYVNSVPKEHYLRKGLFLYYLTHSYKIILMYIRWWDIIWAK